MKVGIIYIAIGEYERFWDIFYPTCQTYFCVDAEKGYELFTDSERLLGLNYPNVHAYKKADEGFIVNVSSKSSFMLDIEQRLQQYDYIFYLNGNFRFLSPIYTKEIVSQSNEFAFTALSFEEYLRKPINELPYDRNPLSGAYIPEGKGGRYYQGGFFGGTYEEIMKFNRWAAQAIENDLKRGVVARFHDESYLNKYLLDKSPHTVNNEYVYYPASAYKGNYKAELIEKAAFFGTEKLFEIRDRYFQPDYSFLQSDTGSFNHIGIIQMKGGLGNQLFVFAFYLYLKNVLKVERQLFIDLSLYETFPFHTGFELQRLFGMDNNLFLSDELRKSISTIPLTVISEKNNSVFQEFEKNDAPMLYYSGYWQCVRYIDSNEKELRAMLKFDISQLDEDARGYLSQIQKSVSAVSIHIRRGDYLNDKNSLIFYNLSESDYYRNAADQLKGMTQCGHTFFVFSDDTEWVKSNFCIENMVIVESADKKSAWQDMYLMSQCKHNIISNSSFSWWAAWLNGNPDKIVVAPGNWFNGVAVPDLIPDNWVIIEPENRFSFPEKVATHLLLQDYKMLYPGLTGGKMGLCIYLFQTARFTNNDGYKRAAENLLEEIYNEIHLCQSLDFGKQGVLGVAAGIQYLIGERYVEGNVDEVLDDIDNYVKEYIHKNVSLPTVQTCDILEYLTSRITYDNLLQDENPAQSLCDSALMLIDSINISNNQDRQEIKKLITQLDKLRTIKSLQIKAEEIILQLVNCESLRDIYFEVFCIESVFKHQL